MMNTTPEIRRLTFDDAPAGVTLAESIGWNHGLELWQQMIQLTGSGAFGLFKGQQLVATALATIYDRALGWIGMVITHPDFQRRGLAKQVMHAAMVFVQDQRVPCLMLDATVSGQPLYMQLGFRPVYQIGIWTIDEPYQVLNSPEPAPVMVRPMLASDFTEVVALDADVFGVARPQVIQNNLGLPYVAVEAGQIAGYFLNRKGGNNQTLGPWYHRSAKGAQALLRVILPEFKTRPLRLLIPEPNEQARQVALLCGFNYQRYCTRMVYGGPIPGHMIDQYAIAAFATG